MAYFVTVNIGAVAEAPWCQWIVALESFVSDAILSAARPLMVLSPGRHGEHPQCCGGISRLSQPIGSSQ
jgi:hypothetical protein